jgi:hypothetical protein
MAHGTGGSKLMNKQLILVVLVIFALFIHTPPDGLSLTISAILLIATIFAVYHNGVQVIDAVVFFVLGVFLSRSYLGDASGSIVSTVADWVRQVTS